MSAQAPTDGAEADGTTEDGLALLAAAALTHHPSPAPRAEAAHPLTASDFRDAYLQYCEREPRVLRLFEKPCSSGANRDDIRQLLRDLNELYGTAAMAAYFVTLADLDRPHNRTSHHYTPLQLNQAREKLKKNKLRPRPERSAFDAACDTLWKVLDRTEGPLPRVLRNLKQAAYQEEIREVYREHARGAASGRGSHSRDA